MTRRARFSLWIAVLAWMVATALILVLPASAQVISIRTVPISQAHQFDLFPSLSRAMGGVSIALDDSLLDPFTNPAKGARIRAGRFFGSPGVYSVSERAGAGQALPLGVLVRSGDWFGGVSLALQRVDLSDPPLRPPPSLALGCFNCPPGFDLGSDARSHGNRYAFAMIGKVFPERGLSVGGSLSWAGLSAVDGVDLLYANSARINQYGDAIDLRVGALKEWADGRSFEAIVLHNRLAATHDVFYADPFWDPGAQRFDQRLRLEQNLDRTNVWGLHLAYQQPLAAAGWRLGWIVTTNLMSHPKIPNYEIQNIPRDPGTSQAFNFGVGVSKTDGGLRVGADLVYEPIWSYTWADAAGEVLAADGALIAPGGKTIENRFRFSNAIFRMGVDQAIELNRSPRALGLQLGLLVHSIDYSLDQRDNVQGTRRHLDEDWVEWTPTWGVSLRFPGWEVRYRGSVTHGTGRPGISSDVIIGIAAPVVGSILVAPSGPLTLAPVRVMTHQVSISFPIR